MGLYAFCASRSEGIVHLIQEFRLDNIASIEYHHSIVDFELWQIQHSILQ